MHFSHAFVAALSVVATQTTAMPVRGVAGPSTGMAARGADVAALNHAMDTLAARGMHADVAEASRGIFARYADVTDEHERSLFIARDLSKRGILDMLVAALRDIIVELLGKGGTARKRDAESKSTNAALQQLTGLDFSTKTAARQSWSQMLDALSKALEQESKALVAQAPGTANATASATADTGLPSVTAGANVTAERKANSRQGNKSKRAPVELMVRQEEGVTGLLQVLRNLVDAILNTLLPMSSRSASTDTSASNSTSKAWGDDCPPAGTPNDGMYRPGCPGYGRRAVSDALLKVRDAASTSQSLQSILPLLEELIQRLPELTGQDTATTASTKGKNGTTTAHASSNGTVAAGNATVSSTAKQTKVKPLSAAKLTLDTRDLLEADGFALGKRQDSSSLADAITSLVQSILEGLLGNDGNSTATNATETANGASSDASSSLLMSLLSSLNRRDLEERGGIDVSILNNLLGNLLSGDNSKQSSDSAAEKRSGIDLSILNNVLGNLLSGDNSAQSSDSAASKRSGIDLSILNNLLGNLLSGDNATQSANSTTSDKRGGIDLSILNNLLGNLLGGDNAAQSADSAASKRSGIDLSILNNVLGNLLSGDNSAQSADSAATKRGSINLNVLNNLLGNLLSGDNSKQSANSAAARRAFIDLTARADFKPVWNEVKKLGNSQFAASGKLNARDAASGLAPVWTSFRDMVDDAYTHGLDRRSPLPSPSPAVDTSAFGHAAAQYVKQTFFHHDKRSFDQFQPLMHAAGSFAKGQMQEWTDALNEHSKQHGKISA